MCGIVGFSGQFDESLLLRMNASIAHRGPDDEGVWCSRPEGIGLAHRRLSIIDLSPLGHQPMWDVTEAVIIVYNGEIYNYRELRDDLLQDGWRFKSQTDTEVLLNLYLRDGIDLLSKSNGIFAQKKFDRYFKTREKLPSFEQSEVKNLTNALTNFRDQCEKDGLSVKEFEEESVI